MSALHERFAALQSPGKRGYQEDEYGVLDADGKGEHLLLVVADGMGGHAGGATASRVVTDSFIEAYRGASGSNSARLQLALDATTTALNTAVANDAALKGMGSTLVAAVITPAGIEWLSVGDSPLWLYRDGSLRRLNADHSMTPILQDMVTSGRLTQDQADTDSRRHSLLSALMGEKPELVDLAPAPLELRADDVVVLASDGMLTLTEPEIAQLLATHSEHPVKELAEKLVRSVERAEYPGQDNITVAVYRSAPMVRSALAATVKAARKPFGTIRVLAVCAIVLALAAWLFLQLDNSDDAVPAPAPVVATPAEIPVQQQVVAAPASAAEAALPPKQQSELARSPTTLDVEAPPAKDPRDATTSSALTDESASREAPPK